MRNALLNLGLLGAVVCVIGCESASKQSARLPMEPAYLPASAALVFNPPAGVDESELYLARDGRGMSADGGVESRIIDETYVYQDDRQRSDRFGDFDRFERRAVSTSVTVRRR